MVSNDYRALVECGCGPIADMAMKCESVLLAHARVGVSVSGGADSDVMVDLVERVRTVTPAEVAYVFFDTGLEYRATIRHIGELEGRYGIRIERVRAEKSIPVSCKEFGQPFLSKHVSEMCERLQRNGFGWADEPYETLAERYPRAITGIKWWCDANTATDAPGWFDIGHFRHLKEFMIESPPWFRISDRCCEWAKKRVSATFERERGIDVMMVGVRRSEGGVRAAHGTCVTRSKGRTVYRPLFWLSADDRATYGRMFGIRHSDCYEVWGFKRTGCSCCPFGRDLDHELDVLDMFEPNVARAARKVFADSYEYRRMFEEFKRRKRDEERGQTTLF